MKKLFLVFALVALVGCQQYEFDEPSALAKKDIQFVMKGLSVEYITRATLQSEGVTDLWIYEGTTMLKHQVSTDADFGAPTVSLSYGSHDLTFVGSKSTGQSFDAVWKCEKVNETFAKVMNVTVSSNSSASRQVELSRRNSKIGFLIEDAIPTGVASVHIKLATNLGLDADLQGVESGFYDVTASVASRVGTTGYNPMCHVLTATNDEEEASALIEFLDASGTVLYHYEKDVLVKPNRMTTIRGSYFAGDVNNISINNQWLDEYEVSI